MLRHRREELVDNNRILLVRTGSRLYGTATDESDDDREGIFIPPREYVFGLRSIDSVDLSIKATDERGRNLPEAVDITYHVIHKYMRQALKNNPNLLELLFAPEENLLFANGLGRRLLAARHLFPHKELCDRYAGYARGQRRKLKKEIDKEPARAASRASHIIRLLKEGIELLETGELQFPLAFADLIVSIKQGEWSVDNVLKLSRELEDELICARDVSSLPSEPRFDEVNQLTINLVERHLATES